MVRNLRQRLNGISGTSCRHGHKDRWDEPLDGYEACEKHHGDAAHNIVMQWLNDPETCEALMEKMGGDSESVRLLCQGFLGTLKEL